ncbi:MAG: hypothetical protein ACPLN0_05345 [Candidatus Hydrothermia bacterium]
MLATISILLIFAQSTLDLSREMELNYLEAGGKYKEALQIATQLYEETGDLYYLKKIFTLELMLGQKGDAVKRGLDLLSKQFDSEVFTSVVFMLREQGKLQEMVPITLKWGDEDSIQAYKGYLFYLLNDFRRAYGFFSKSSKYLTDKGLLISAYADVLWRLNKTDELKDFLLEVQDISKEIVYLKGLYYRLLGDYNMAREVFSKLLGDWNYKDFGFLKIYVEVLDESGDYEKADSVIELLTQLYPFYGESHKVAGIHYYRAGKLENSFKELLVANALVEGDGDIHYYLARVLAGFNSFRDALSEIEMALSIAPYSVDYKYYKIYILLNLDSLSAALREIYLLELQGVKSGYLYYLKGNCFERMNEYKLASESFRTALEIDSLDLKRYYDFLYHAYSRGIGVDFDYYLDKALRQAKNQEDSIYISYLAMEIKRYPFAIKILENYVNQDTVSPAVLNNLAFAICESGADLHRALGLVDRALDREPDNYYFLDTKAWILYKLERLEEAQYYIKKAVELGGEKEEEIRSHWEQIFNKKWHEK